jgi:hypothetical protein
MSPVELFLRREWIYANRFLRVVTLRPTRVRPAHQPDPAKRAAEWVASMGVKWQPEMERQMRDLAILLDYLHQRQVRVQVVLPPLGTWLDGLPFQATYRRMLAPILTPRRIEMIDLGDLLPDEDFTDAVHLRYSGQRKLHRVYRKLALDALRHMGTALPAGS